MLRIERHSWAPWVVGWVSLFALTIAAGCSGPVREEALGVRSEALTASPWAPGVAYAVGDLASHNGKVYRVVQAHTSQGGWTPDAVPALFAFEAIDSGSNVSPK